VIVPIRRRSTAERLVDDALGERLCVSADAAQDQ
jgi:hypothetical protein